MFRVYHYIFALSLFLFLLTACQPVNYYTLKDMPERSTIYLRKEVTGERESWDIINAYYSRIDGSRPGIFSSQNVAYFSPGTHRLEIMATASYGYNRPFWSMWDADSKEWDDTKVLEVNLLPGKEYDLLVSIHMSEDHGEFKINFKKRDSGN